MKEKSVIAGLGALVGRLIDEHRSMGDRCRELAAHCSEVEQENRMLRERLRVQEKEIIFTSGGTESNNMALIGAALANHRAGNHIISTRIEHASVYQPLSFLENQGFRVTYLDVDREGHIFLEQLSEAIGPDTILVSVMYVNNEIGAVEPVGGDWPVN